MKRATWIAIPWLIPLVHAAGSTACSLVLSRIGNAIFPAYTLGMSAASAQAFLSAVASGMMALTGDQTMARQEDRQGLGLSRKPSQP
jgi:hypothetical protein